MTSDDDQMLADLANEMVADTANSLLDRQVKKTRQWVQQSQEQDLDDSLYALIKHCLKEPSKRSHIISAYCAALIRIIEMEDERERAIDEADWA